MKLWISGEVDADVGDAFRITMNEVENKINLQIDFNRYGVPLHTWDIIMVISGDGGSESFRYNKKSRDYSVRMVIPHEEFKGASANRRTELFVDNLMRSLDQLSLKRADDFLVSDLRRDITLLFNGES